MRWDEQQPLVDVAQMPERVLKSFIESAERAVARLPESSRTRINLGIALLKNAKAADAVEVLRVAVKLDPSDQLAQVTLADALFHSGQLPEAFDIYTGLVNRGLFVERVALGISAIALRQNDYAGARKALVSALGIKKETAELWFLLGMVELKQGNPSKAIGALRTATRLSDSNPAFQHSLGVAYAISRNCDAAIRAFRIALALSPQCVDTIHALGRVLIDKGDSEEAARLLAPHVEKAPDDEESRYLLARAYAHLGRHQTAQIEFTRVLRTSVRLSEPQRVMVLNSLAESFMRLGKAREAELALIKAIKTAPRSSPIPYDNLGRVYLYHLEKPIQAEEVLHEARALFPESQSTAVLLAISLQASGETRGAISELVSFSNAGIGDESTHICLGWLYGQAKDIKNAIAVLSEGLKKFPASEGIVNNLAYTYLMAEDVDRAADVLGLLPEDTVHPERVATYGLLRLWRDQVAEGRELYKKAETMAAGDPHKVKKIKQKQHLEVARLYLRRGDLESARKEISAGLAIPDFPLSFRKELLEIQAGVVDKPVS